MPSSRSLRTRSWSCWCRRWRAGVPGSPAVSGHRGGSCGGPSRRCPLRSCSAVSTAGLTSASPTSSSISATAPGAGGAAGTQLHSAATPTTSAAWLHLVSAGGSTRAPHRPPTLQPLVSGASSGLQGGAGVPPLTPFSPHLETPPPPYSKASCGPSWPDEPQHPGTQFMEFSYNGGDWRGKRVPPCWGLLKPRPLPSRQGEHQAGLTPSRQLCPHPTAGQSRGAGHRA